MNTRRAAILGLAFPAIAVFYAVFELATVGYVDPAGVTLLLAMGIAIGVMAVTLAAGANQG
jgi:hypothetical protein